MSGHGEGETHVHAAAVAFDGCIQEAFAAGEVDDGIELAFDFLFPHAEDLAVEVDVFATGEFRMEAGADFEEAADASKQLHFAGGGFGDAREYFKERAF